MHIAQLWYIYLPPPPIILAQRCKYSANNAMQKVHCYNRPFEGLKKNCLGLVPIHFQK
jgi:hypothetical protein